MGDDTNTPSGRKPPRNEIVPQKKVEIWDQLLANVQRQLTTIAGGIELVARDIKKIDTKIDTLTTKVDTVKGMVLFFGIVNTVLLAVLLLIQIL